MNYCFGMACTGCTNRLHCCEKLCTGCTNHFSLLREALYRVYEPFFTTARSFVQGVRTIFHYCERFCTVCTSHSEFQSFQKYHSSSTEPVPSRGFLSLFIVWIWAQRYGESAKRMYHCWKTMYQIWNFCYKATAGTASDSRCCYLGVRRS